jgi:sulfonate transport system permease protein
MVSSALDSFLRSRWFSPLLLIALWEILGRFGIIPAHTLAVPSSVATLFFEMIRTGELQANLMVSLTRATIGFAAGVAIGSTLALVAGLTARGEAILDPLMQIKRTIPSVALVPLFIVWFGIGETPKILLIAFATAFPVYLNLHLGIRSMDVRLIDAGRSFGLHHAALIREVILPGSLPSFLTGLRYASSVAIVMLVIAEQINADAGIGYLVTNARDFMRTDVIVLCLFIYAGLGLIADFTIRAMERQMLAWRPAIIAT